MPSPARGIALHAGGTGPAAPSRPMRVSIADGDCRACARPTDARMRGRRGAFGTGRRRVGVASSRPVAAGSKPLRGSSTLLRSSRMQPAAVPGLPVRSCRPPFALPAPVAAVRKGKKEHGTRDQPAGPVRRGHQSDHRGDGEGAAPLGSAVGQCPVWMHHAAHGS